MERGRCLKGSGWEKIKTRGPLLRARNLISVSNPNDFHKRKMKAQLVVSEYNILEYVNLFTNYCILYNVPAQKLW